MGIRRSRRDAPSDSANKQETWSRILNGSSLRRMARLAPPPAASGTGGFRRRPVQRRRVSARLGAVHKCAERAVHRSHTRCCRRGNLRARTFAYQCSRMSVWMSLHPLPLGYRRQGDGPNSWWIPPVVHTHRLNSSLESFPITVPSCRGTAGERRPRTPRAVWRPQKTLPPARLCISFTPPAPNSCPRAFRQRQQSFSR